MRSRLPLYVCSCVAAVATTPAPSAASAASADRTIDAAARTGDAATRPVTLPGRRTAARRASARRRGADDLAAANDDDGHDRQHGNASFYSHHLHGRPTASGQAYDANALTAAHRTLPLGTQLRVVNPKNDRSVVVTVNDRGPFSKNRVLDVSSAAAHELGMKRAGVTRVETQVVGKVDPSASTR